MPFGFQQYGQTQYNPYVAIVVTSVAGGPIDDEGGMQLTAVGTFPINSSMTAHLGSAGTAADAPCYGGAVHGYHPISTDGATLILFAPPLEKGLNKLTIVYNAQTVVFQPITVLERNWKSRNLSMRACFPPWYDVGSPRLEEEARR